MTHKGGSRKPLWRARDILGSIAQIRSLLEGRTYADTLQDLHARAAFERYLEIISEASRHLPDEWKSTHGADLPWRNIADIGNQLRHRYEQVSFGLIWTVYERDLDVLESAVVSMIKAEE
jgi:uncharacterized protein with HEPN domain